MRTLRLQAVHWITDAETFDFSSSEDGADGTDLAPESLEIWFGAERKEEEALWGLCGRLATPPSPPPGPLGTCFPSQAVSGDSSGQLAQACGAEAGDVFWFSLKEIASVLPGMWAAEVARQVQGLANGLCGWT